jgi:membrane protease YdiL (CAAX protease family)
VNAARPPTVTGQRVTTFDSRDRWRRVVAAAVPAVMPPAMMMLFKVLNGRYGDRRGYRAAMVGYWMLCTALPVAIAGPHRLASMLSAPRRPMPRPRWLAVAAVAVPPLGAVATELAPQLRLTTRRAMATALAVGITNAAAEDLLWKGMPTALFPEDPVLGWMVPAVGFTAWHLAPLSVRPHPRGRYPILIGAAIIGAGSGWVAWSTGSLRAATAMHAITDSCGVRAARSVWIGS